VKSKLKIQFRLFESGVNRERRIYANGERGFTRIGVNGNSIRENSCNSRQRKFLATWFAWEKRQGAAAVQDADARIHAKLDLKVFHRRFRCADFAVNN